MTRDRSSFAVIANYPGKCQACGDRFDQGSKVALLDRKWVHAACAEANGIRIVGKGTT